MERAIKSIAETHNQTNGENRSAESNHGIEYRKDDDNDEYAMWSVSSNGDTSRSSYDNDLSFQRFSNYSNGLKLENTDRLSRGTTTDFEYIELVNSLKTKNKAPGYFYDGVEEALLNSDDETTRKDTYDQRMFNNGERMSLTREQLVEYQHFMKLLRFNGGRCTTILSLSLLHDHNLQDYSAFLAFKDSSSINILLNFIEMYDRDLKLNALLVLEDACQNSLFAHEIFSLGGVVTVINSMCLDHVGIQKGCSILHKLLLLNRTRKVIRRFGGISKLISLLGELSEKPAENDQAISSISQVLLMLCRSEKNKYVCIRYGIGQILVKIISSIRSDSLAWTLSLIGVLLQTPIFRLQITDMNIITHLVNFIDLKDIELTRTICESLYYLSLDINLLQLIYRHGAKKLKCLLEQVKDPSIFCSVVNIIAEFIQSDTTISKDIILNTIWFFKNYSNPSYLLRITRSLNELTKFPQSLLLFKEEKIFLDFIFHLRNENNAEIQLNILLIMCKCAKDPESAKMVIENNGLQDVWSLFKSAPLPVKTAAAWTIKNCLASNGSCGELIRSFDGVFYLIINTLLTDSVELLTATLSMVAEIVKDEYNREILTDLGVISKILELNNLEDVHVRKPLCEAIANLLDLPRNQKLFGNQRIILVFKHLLQEQNLDLLSPLTKIVYDLSRIPSNCVLLHNAHIAADLLKMIANDDPVIQERSAKILRNMRRLLDVNRRIERRFIEGQPSRNIRKERGLTYHSVLMFIVVITQNKIDQRISIQCSNVPND